MELAGEADKGWQLLWLEGGLTPENREQGEDLPACPERSVSWRKSGTWSWGIL